MGAVEKALVSSESSAMYAADEPRLLCLINDTVSNASKITMNLPKSTSCQYFLNDVARKIHMAPSAVEVFYEPAGRGEQVSVSNFLGQTMGDLCMGDNRHNFFVTLKDGVSQPPERNTSVVNEASAELVNIDNKEIYNSGDNYATNTAPQNPAYSINTSSYGYNSSLAKSDTGHVGLVNQAMTCYLNSLLQTLYMTPEFRNAVYRWEYCGSDEEAVKSIPYQLQRLFLLLQTSTKRAVETTDITKSFGWDSSEAWQQHDVQELCRVMFDALEKNWKDTDQANLITQLYQGKIKDYVKCLQCHSESARIDTFLDIPLVVRPFGSNTGYGSVEDALRAFVEHEILEGTNQYFCEKCNCKCNAHKGLKFLAFPYLLTLQLKRFDFDYSTMHRIKLNDRMSFPERLNLSEFVEAENEKEFLASSKESKAGDEAAGGDSPLIHSRPDPDEGVDEGIDIADCASGNIAPECTGASKNSVTNKPANVFEYELFSIMVHSGGASGGHYYAYIKSFQDGQWYSFNDQHVYRIVEDDIEKTFGGNSYGSNYYSYSSYSSSANAYMLMYRQVDTQRNKAFLLESEFPPHLLKQLNLLKNRDEEEQRKREIERNTCKIKLFHWDDLTKKYTESKLEVHRSKTLAEATYMAWKQLGLRSVMIIDFRLVRFDSSHEYIDSSIEDEWTTPFHQILGGVKSVYGFDLLAETKKRDQQFESYYSGDVMIRAIPVDVERETILEPLNIRLSPTKTIYDFKQVVADKLGIPTADNIRCVIERYYNTLKPLDLGQKTLQSEGFQKTNKIFVSLSCSREEQRLAFEKTAMYHLLDRHQNTIRLIVHVPKMPVVAQAVNVIASEENEDTQIEDNDSSVPLLMDAEEKSNPDMDEGIGESETDVISMADTAGDSAITSTMTVDQVESETGHTNTADPDCNPMNTGETSDNVVSSWHSVSASNNDVGLDESSRADLTSVHGDFVNAGIEFDESSLIKLPDYDNVGSVEFTSDMLTSHSLSQDSSSSRTVEVGEEIPSPSPLGDDEYSDRATPSPRTSPSPPITPPPVSPPAVSPSMEDSSMSTSFACDPPIMQSAIPNNSEEIDNSKDMATKKESNEYWDQELPDLRADDDLMTSVDQSRYFAVERTVFPLGYERTLYVHVDRRITLKGLKTFLESYVGTNTDNFRVFKFSQGGQEVEETRLSDSLVNYVHDTRVNIKYGRALKNGEQRIQIYQLVLNDAEPIKLLNEVVLAKGMTVGDAKTVIVEELRSERILDISVNQCRLRRKCWKNPSHIYTDNSSTLEESVGNHLNSELLLEVLPESGEPLPVNHTHNELSIYVRRWWPSKFQIDGVQEIVTDNLVLENLLSKISDISGIEPENIFVAKGRGAFPCDLSVLEAEKDLEWNPNVLSIVQWPLSITDDGSVVFYKDRRETLQELTDEQRKQLQQKENTRLMKRVSPQPFSAKKERALKIYTDDRPSAAKPAKTMELSPPSPSLD